MTHEKRLEAAKRWLGPRYLLAAPINRPRIVGKAPELAAAYTPMTQRDIYEQCYAHYRKVGKT